MDSDDMNDNIESLNYFIQLRSESNYIYARTHCIEIKKLPALHFTSKLPILKTLTTFGGIYLGHKLYCSEKDKPTQDVPFIILRPDYHL